MMRGLAYQFIQRGGYNHRSAARVKQYDEWIIKEAIEREDYATAIKSMSAMLSKKLIMQLNLPITSHSSRHYSKGTSSHVNQLSH